MMSDQKKIRDLLHAYLQNKLSASQTEELFQYLQDKQELTEPILHELAEAYENKMQHAPQLSPHISQRMLQSLLTKINKAPVISIQQSRSNSWKRWVAAASILIAVGLGSYFVISKRSEKSQIASNQTQHTGADVLPGSYKAKLTLANGETIILDSAALGELTKQGSTAIINKDGQLVYDDSKLVTQNSALLYNTVSTAKGETYSLTLADGSIVSLNAGSSVYFPVAFTGKERRVVVTGEVYIKVAKDAAHPFIAAVSSPGGGSRREGAKLGEGAGMEVLALGTEFNINAYGDEGAMKTTLVEGSVKVSKVNESVIIKPGEQAVATQSLSKGHSPFTIHHSPDLEKTLAWINQKFIFDHDELPTIMRQLARWYDVEVVYEGKLPDYKFSGIISRQRNASAVLEMLKATGNINFRIEGKKIIVTP